MKPLASSKVDRAQSKNVVSTTRWSGTHVTSLKRRALSWVGPGLIPLAKDARRKRPRNGKDVRESQEMTGTSGKGQEMAEAAPKSQEMARMSKKVRKWQEYPGKAKKWQKFLGKARKWQECPGKPRNGRDVRVSQEMARISKQARK
ncbi:hypothetical protein Taro_039315 [Colocasia esculenta]|uniref:Uncharacterized protein n=1 Tax=Colocasia esculenta TaxID=4460 RepID=A0A843WIH6_COLES|nr:hypothetical protein [Colocasia esculenta]